ncbi:ANTAR domain-containing response regulator [Paenibacillus cymbidii]|uniref:ANTAR domain-containing response regulator n=1 Tax=Paenibacillus cymbidii TaxID=1639034 RepID=UPI00108013A5|nr:ANTAR domain-containing protein [Paenibacillus cymbidii]
MLKAVMIVEDAARLVSLHSLQHHCRQLIRVKSETEVKERLESVEAVVLHVPAARASEWQETIAGMRKLPVFWFCSETASPKEMDWGYTLDGVLFATLGTVEMQFALKWGIRTFQLRKRWAEEREQLLQRIEERKWIDQAKAVLCEVKGISEAEAYEFLRKQAMKERKRIGDIAASIVKVYQLIHG